MDSALPDSLPILAEHLLDYVHEHVPTPLYKAIYLILASGSLIFSRLVVLATDVFAYSGWDWEPQKFIPPLILAFCAYYALLSILRTAGFMIRTTLWIAKWSIIVVVLSAGFSFLSSMEEPAGGRLQNFRSSAASRSTRPRPWHAFDVHQQWRVSRDSGSYAQSKAGEDPMVGAQQFIQNIVGYAGRAVGGVAFEVYENARTLFESVGDPAAVNNKDGPKPRRRQRAAGPNDSYSRKKKASSR